MDKMPEPHTVTAEEIERAVDIFSVRLSEAYDECAEADLTDLALISAVFAGLVELTHRSVGANTLAVLRQMIADLDVEGSPLGPPSPGMSDPADLKLN